MCAPRSRSPSCTKSSRRSTATYACVWPNSTGRGKTRAMSPPLLVLVLAVTAPSIPYEKYTLPNGLEVILSPDHRVPVVHVNVVYHVGSKDDPTHRTGFAHLFEHMMFQGSRDLAEDTWFKKLEAVGAFGINGTTNTERTNHFESVPANE